MSKGPSIFEIAGIFRRWKYQRRQYNRRELATNIKASGRRKRKKGPWTGRPTHTQKPRFADGGLLIPPDVLEDRHSAPIRLTPSEPLYWNAETGQAPSLESQVAKARKARGLA